jgi:hypothetical protein
MQDMKAAMTAIEKLGDRAEVSVLFIFEDWQILSDESLSITCYAQHSCQAHGGWSWLLTDSTTKCWGCKTTVPDEVQGLIQMLAHGKR